MITYINLVNNVLTRLRESDVSAINENSYSKLIGLLINDSKTEIENAWNWSTNRTTLTAATTVDRFSFILTGAQNRSTMLDVIDDTNNTRLQYATASQFNDWYLTNTAVSGKPKYYSFNGIDSNGDTKVEIYPPADGVYNIRFNMVLRLGDLVLLGDEMDVPKLPVELLAYAKAIEERGEDGGVGSSSAYAAAARALGDAIALDANKHPEELIWENH